MSTLVAIILAVYGLLLLATVGLCSAAACGDRMWRDAIDRHDQEQRVLRPAARANGPTGGRACGPVTRQRRRRGCVR
ncbi:MAG: hypothetical protein ACRDLV_03640 [Solirubrobacteraceae bacterium]